MNKKNIYFLITTIIILVIFCFFITWKQGLQVGHLKIGGQIIKIEVAETPESQEKGLSFRKSLKDNEGMFFVFKNSGKYSFWMKDMNFPIDIIWLDGQKKIIFIKKNALPLSYPETITPSEDALYVLEVNAGFSEKNNLKEGNSVEFLP